MREATDEHSIKSKKVHIGGRLGMDGWTFTHEISFWFPFEASRESLF